MAGQGSEQAGSLRYFSGDAEDAKEYKRWKVWCQNKLLTLDKLPESSHGAWIYTLLSGKALEAVEHLDPEVYQKKDGDKALWKYLDQRFPQKDDVDELGEILGGWVTLHRCGLSDEQKAVVIARAGGDLNREKVASSLRSCYPELIHKRRAAMVVDEVFQVDEDQIPEPLETEFSDIQDLMDEHQVNEPAEDEAFPEEEVAEVLAATWKEKRQELNRLQRSRQFGKAKEIRREFRVEVEELKAKTTCHRCGKRGHWARECKAPKNTQKNQDRGSSSSASGAAMVVPLEEKDVNFVAAVASLDKLRAKVPCRNCGRLGHWFRNCPDRVSTGVASVDSSSSLMDRTRARASDETQPCQFNVALVSCPGFGVLDSGCGRSIVGISTLREFEKLWRSCGMTAPTPVQETHQFKYGNGEVETSTEVVATPVRLAGWSDSCIHCQGTSPIAGVSNCSQIFGSHLGFQK